MKNLVVAELLVKIDELENRLAESDQLIGAIKAGEVDAFALYKNNQSEIFTLQSGDFAYRILVENFNEGALNLSAEGLIVYTNSYFHNLLNLSYEKVIGHSVFNFVHPESKNDFAELLSKGAKGQSKGEIILSVQDKIVPVYISLTSLYPTLDTVGMIVTDLSEKRRHENLLHQKNMELEERNQQLIQSNMELDSFSYIASHDLQEPLRKIRVFTSRILEKEYMMLSENGKGMFNRMVLAANRMQILIEDLLVYSRASTSERKFEKIHLNKIIDEVREDLQEELKEKNATIESGDLCHLKALPFQMRQLMLNLISNSLKFSKPNHKTVIVISSKLTTGDKLPGNKFSGKKKFCHITVADNGIGFEPAYNEKIFELFHRLHDKDQYSGTGIGLSIVKRIVENHNGIITARGELDKGASFEIFIPVSDK